MSTLDRGSMPLPEEPRGRHVSPDPAPSPPDHSPTTPDPAPSTPERRPGEPDAPLPRVLRRPVRGRSEVTGENIAELALVEEDSSDAVVLRRILERRRTAHAALYVEELRDLASLWDAPEGEDDGDVYAVAVGMVLHTRINRATSRLRDAYIAVTDLPQCLALVEVGVLPTEWFDHLVRSVRNLRAVQRHRVDEKVAEWEIESLSPERFWNVLRTLVLWFGRREADGTPESKRDVQVDYFGDAVAGLTVTGPIPEILDMSKRLDRAAHAVQDAQRRALERIAAGEPDVEIPWDVYGDAAATGRHMTLAALRYVLLTRSEISTAGVPTPKVPLRMNLVVPVFSLLGLTDAPAMLDGTIPIHPEMARALCADAPVWHRVLTDPISGEFLPTAAQQYRPTTAMLEHVKLVDPICAVPGCSRKVIDLGEVDHIEEYDHLHPHDGGPTSPENLHGLCWFHHDEKTSGALDPERTADGMHTRWSVDGIAWMDTAKNTDLVTATLAADYQRFWDRYLEDLRTAKEPPPPPPPAPDYGDPPF